MYKQFIKRLFLKNPYFKKIHLTIFYQIIRLKSNKIKSEEKILDFDPEKISTGAVEENIGHTQRYNMQETYKAFTYYAGLTNLQITCF